VAETSGYGLGYLTPEEMSADAQLVLDDALAALDTDIVAARADGREVSGRLLEGMPGPTLVTEAKGAGVLVVGRSGHTGLARLVVGSVSRYVTNHAPCPVVIIPEP
jgi:nucleotide-binding universal stress UspA family protein